MRFKKLSFIIVIVNLLVSPFLYAATSPATTAPATPALGDLTIIVSSCDKYAELWDGFFTLLYKQMPSLQTTNAKLPVLLVSNKKSFPDPRIQIIHTSAEEGWSNNMLDALKQVKTKYVLYLQDDYFLTKFDEKRFAEIYNEMRSARVISYIQVGVPDEKLITGDTYGKLAGLRYRGKHDEFRTNLQAAIWKTEDLAFLIRPGENPWLFEDKSNTRSQGFRTPFLVVVKDVPLEYLNMADQGFLVTRYVAEAKKLGVEMAKANLPLDTEKRAWKIYLARVMKKLKG